MIRLSPGFRLVVGMVAMLLGCFVASLISTRWGLGIDWQRHPSNPFRVYLHDKAHRQVERGDYATFRIPEFASLFPGSDVFVKRVAAVEGDRLQIVGRDLYVNGVWIARINPIILARVGLNQSRLGDLDRVPPGRLLMLGSSERSFDGRYFGLIPADGLQGRAIPLW